MTSRRAPRLSKSRFVSGLQCHLKLWYDCYERGNAAAVDPVQQAIFDTGHEVGRVATGRQPGGLLVTSDHLHPEEAVIRTRAALEDESIPAIFEGGFIHENVVVRADILARAKAKRWDLVEVKSSASLKDEHLPDVAVQCWVLAGSGVRLGRAGVLTLNTAYVYPGGPYDLDRLFVLHDVTDTVRSMRRDVAAQVAELHAMLQRPARPVVAPGEHCHAPHECPYQEHCNEGRAIPAHPITELPRLHSSRRAALEALGIAEIADIPSDFRLTGPQRRVRDCAAEDREWVSAGLAETLEEPRYPIHHLDFETFAPALPRYPGTRPYQSLPFQWSNHIESTNGTVGHQEFLCGEDKDPREELVRTLLDSLGNRGTICIYTSYEKTTVRALARHLPRLSRRLSALDDRFWDLCAAIKANHYHRDFHGSFSLKSVLPALVPEMRYDAFDIRDGKMASVAYAQSIRTREAAERERLRAALLAYCAQDTLAMVRIRQALAARCSSS